MKTHAGATSRSCQLTALELSKRRNDVMAGLVGPTVGPSLMVSDQLIQQRVQMHDTNRLKYIWWGEVYEPTNGGHWINDPANVETRLGGHIEVRRRAG